MSLEIRVHRILFFFVLVPLLGYWLPALMFSLGFAFALITSASVAEHDMSSGPGALAPWLIGFGLPVVTLTVGWFRERAQRAKADQAALIVGMRLPDRQGTKLCEIYERVWRDLGGAGSAPRLICLPNFRITAHAYDGPTGCAIEISSGLATRLVQNDPLGLTILRHEIAHLVHDDLPAIRLQSLLAGAALFSANWAILICLFAAAVVVILTDFGPFPKSPNLANIVLVHAAIAFATLIVVLPLLLGRYALQRYSGLLVALAEMRADVSAGLWGGGLKEFSSQVERDATVKPVSMLDKGLAYISTVLSHFPSRERVALLRDPQRLATPKMRYFTIAILCLWFLQFHQGSQGWDRLLLALSVALLQGLTVGSVLVVAGRLALSPARATVLAIGTLALQALPLISIEGLAYLAMHLTAMLVMPGGFGAGDADVFGDVRTTLAEFFRFAWEAIGGALCPLAFIIAAGSYLAINRTVGIRRPSNFRIFVVGAFVALCSLLVSYGFFQPQLQAVAEAIAYGWSSQNDEPNRGYWLPATARDGVSITAFRVSDYLDDTKLLASAAWLRLALPQFAGIIFATLLIWRPGKHYTPSSDTM